MFRSRVPIHLPAYNNLNGAYCWITTVNKYTYFHRTVRETDFTIDYEVLLSNPNPIFGELISAREPSRDIWLYFGECRVVGLSIRANR